VNHSKKSLTPKDAVNSKVLEAKAAENKRLKDEIVSLKADKAEHEIKLQSEILKSKGKFDVSKWVNRVDLKKTYFIIKGSRKDGNGNKIPAHGMFNHPGKLGEVLFIDGRGVTNSRELARYVIKSLTGSLSFGRVDPHDAGDNAVEAGWS
tara:strand:+ start:123 stop:572 length:450 start_codon:yes stop_codon:yes gene_type:complete